MDRWVAGSGCAWRYALHLDSDLVADIKLDQADIFGQALELAFYVDTEMIQDAIHRRSSFNLIHRETMFKVDVFIPKQRPFELSQLNRRSKQVVAVDPQRSAFVCTAEDILLAKLEWYRMGVEVSERQWRDVLGVMAVQGERLDLEYLRHWAGELGVSDLLERALEESSPGD